MSSDYSIPAHLAPSPYTGAGGSSTAASSNILSASSSSTTSPSSPERSRPLPTNPYSSSSTSNGNTNRINKINNNDTTFQIIDEEKKFNPHLLEYFRQAAIDKCGLNYHIVSVFGSQSTGKSTLLNALFGTRFDVMNEIQRQQTTKGIWMAAATNISSQPIFSSSSSLASPSSSSSSLSSSPNLLIMDVEGTDGRERGEDQDFERKSALFALATSEILIVNMWENQVGLYQGANMALLKTVFEVNLALFNASAKASRSLILFVIRDHIGTTPLANLRATVIADLKRIWESLSKPPTAAHSSIEDFFDLQFCALPHKILMAEQFAAQTAALSQQFTQPQAPGYLFKPEYHRGVPLDGWPMYTEQIWEQIEQNKDLDLPTQQTLVARFRCEEIASQAWQQFESGLLEAQHESNNALGGPAVVEDFGGIISNIRGGTMELYDSLASRYTKAVYIAKREDLQSKIDTRLSNLYKAQLIALHKNAVNVFKSLIKAASSKQHHASSIPFIEILRRGRTTAIEGFVSGARKSSVDASVFTYNDELAALEQELATIEESAKATEIKRISNVAHKKITKSFGTDLESYFIEPTQDTWDKVLVYFNNTVMFALSAVAKRQPDSDTYDFGVGGNAEENARGVREIRRSAWIALDHQLKQVTRDDNVLFRLRERFEDLFKYDSSGVPIVWKAGDNIEGPYLSARDDTLKLLPIFATARLKNGTLVVPDVDSDKVIDLTDDDDNHHSGKYEDDDDSSALDADTFPYRISSSKEQDLSKRFKKQADAAFVEAKRSTTQLAKQVPLYMIVLLVVLGWNEFMAVLRNPIFFLLLLLGGAGLYVTYSLNMWGPILSVTNAMVDRTIEVGKQRLREVLEIPEGSNVELRSQRQQRRNVEEIPLQEIKSSNRTDDE
ncbi:uncharacterized protein SAPINGB_P001955 [Magnusiomyces paraingens]|uniref:GB1/RHD3-type G domain-containing protein n=1 Tax=Magnusiomyces paraingens TaxID=2606893 RepID=A0A5E8BJB3_9ASCO|nr:uncharacterized protein SAPINGB_P001955 [Saprochaete ingens]VVT48795.1 unnamed protein product [Saprochaete ingens]